MDKKTKLWIKYLISAVVTGIGAGFMLSNSYDIGRYNGVEYGATMVVNGIQKAYGDEKCEEICGKACDALKIK